jgi:hypothetical protein
LTPNERTLIDKVSDAGVAGLLPASTPGLGGLTEAQVRLRGMVLYAVSCSVDRYMGSGAHLVILPNGCFRA